MPTIHIPDFALAFFFASLTILVGLILTRALIRERGRRTSSAERLRALEARLKEAAPVVQPLDRPFGAPGLRVKFAPDPERKDSLEECEVLWPSPDTLLVRGPVLGGTLPVRLDIPPPRGLAGLFRGARTGSELFDETCSADASPLMRSFVQALIDDGRLVEPVVVLRRLPGVTSVRIETGQEAGTARFRLEGDELTRDASHLESMLHNLARIGRALRPS